MLLLLTITAVVGIAVAGAGLIAGARRIRVLSTIAPVDDGPLVSIVVAARNEEQGIEAGVRSLLRTAYRSVEIIVVNDRSTDHTAAILERVRAEDPRLTIATVSALPPGWLGKNHALALGATEARGELLLFTDADVVFDPSMIGRAVRVLQDDGLDHLTASPGVRLNGPGLKVLVTAFSVLFSLYARPWKARDPRSRGHIGIGAFNLLRASAYQRIGTHAAIALRPDDDMRLAREVKRKALSQDIVRADPLLTLEWYPTVGAMVDGLMKNSFAGVNYSVLRLCVVTAGLLVIFIWPWVALVGTRGGTWGLALTAALIQIGIVARHAAEIGVPATYALLYPAGVLGLIYVMWRSALLALVRGAVTWRDTSYPLSALRKATPAQPLTRTRRV